MRLVVVGDPIDHSLSPLLHTAAFQATGLLGSYEKRRVAADQLGEVVEEIRRGDLDGANVTMPHKELAAQLCDRLAASAARAGAVNTLVRVAGKVVGHNTDIAGIRSAWAEAGLPHDKPVLVLGSGGAAAAALLALEGRQLLVSARRPQTAQQLAERVGVSADSTPWQTPMTGAVLVNATPVGMLGESLDPAVLAAASGLFDMAYGSQPTPAVGDGRSRGLPVADGRLMLLHQAAAAFELWTGHTAPVAEMTAALETSASADCAW